MPMGFLAQTNQHNLEKNPAVAITNVLETKIPLVVRTIAEHQRYVAMVNAVEVRMHKRAQEIVRRPVVMASVLIPKTLRTVLKIVK